MSLLSSSIVEPGARRQPAEFMAASPWTSRALLAYKPRSAGRDMQPVPAKNAQVAQLVEQRTENPRVGGSIPPLGTIFFNGLANTVGLEVGLR